MVNQKFILTLDQQRGPNDGEDLNIAATHALAVATDNLIEELKIPEDCWMTSHGSREHRREELTGETWKVPVGDFFKPALYTQFVLQKLPHVLNSREFITNDIGLSVSVLFSRPERKGVNEQVEVRVKRYGKTWQRISKCLCEIKNKDELCCARVIVTMRDYTKRQAGESNTFENIKKDRGKNSQQLKETKKLHVEAGVPEGACRLQEIEQFQDYLGPQCYGIIVVDAVLGGVIFKGAKYQEALHRIDLVTCLHLHDENVEKAHYDGLYSKMALCIFASLKNPQFTSSPTFLSLTRNLARPQKLE